ncbi:MAG: hypothetical protein JNM09_01300 [Blastocatellia bacterium]|nr:hypothetical protein [Blastocatellia bacterium]
MTTSATSTASTKSIAPQAQKALAYLRRAIEKMKALQAAERVMSSLERVMLNRIPDKLDFAPLVASINDLNIALRGVDEDKIREAVCIVNQEMEIVFQVLVARDAAIMPYHLRRFCEEETTSLDLNALAALTSFYRALPHTDANRGKYDFVVTRLFSNIDPGHSTRHRHLRISREQLAKRLTEMCLAWGETIVSDPADAHRISQSIQQFDEFIAEAKQINRFEELVNRTFFQRVRDLKTQVGSLLYLPEVTAASVESNVIINNRFLTLLEIESAELQAASPSLQSLTNAFSDTYSNEPDEISSILRELQTHAQNDNLAQERVSRLTHLLQISPPVIEREATLSNPSLLVPFANGFHPSPETLPESVVSLEPEVAVEMDEQLQALAADPENQLLVTAYLHASAETRKLDLHSFLSPLPDGDHTELEGEGKIRRATLGLIFQADQIVQMELGKDCDPSADIEARIEKLFDQLGELSDKVRDYIKVTAKHEQNANYEVLLQVYNQLMTVRLRLQSAIVRRTTTEASDTVAPTEIHASPSRVQEAPLTPEKTRRLKPGSQNNLRKWLVVAIIILLAVALGTNFLRSRKQEAKDDTDVTRLDRSQMPHGAFFTEVKLHQDLMICLVTQQWLELAASEQKVKLREIFTYGQGQGAQRIMLVNLKGTTVGFVSKDDVFVN